MRATTRRSLRRITAATLAFGALTTAAAPSAGAGPREDARRRAAFPVAVGYDFDYAGVPDRLKRGTYDFTFVNGSPTQEHELVLFKLDDKKDTVDDVIAAADAATGPDDPYFSDFRGVSFAEPLGVQPPERVGPGFFVGRADLTDAGRYAYLCFIPDPQTGKPHYQLGMVGTLDVK